MAAGKYSPTVAAKYAADQKWWEKNGGGKQADGTWKEFDADGYDSYGYDVTGKDRDGKTEDDYMFESFTEDQLVFGEFHENDD